MKDTKISIIVPVYNSSLYLNRCLDSLINQTLSEIEILIYDDKSLDNSVEIIEEYQSINNQIILTKNITNIGSGAIRNLGMKQAKGKYIMFVDSDDWINLNSCKILYHFAELLETDILVGGYFLANSYIEQINLINSIEYSEVVDGMTYLSKNKIFTSVWDKLWLKSYLLTNNLKNIEGRYSQDLPMVIEGFIKAKRVASVNFKFYYYFRGNLNSVTKGKSTDKHLIDRIWTMNYIQKQVEYNKDSVIENQLLWLLANQVIPSLSNIRRYNGNNKVLKSKFLKQITNSSKICKKQLLDVDSFPYYKRLIVFISPTLYNFIFTMYDKIIKNKA